MGIAHQCYFLKNHKNITILGVDRYINDTLLLVALWMALGTAAAPGA